jgi:multiple sugar transport system substrate-binding protein
MKGIFTRSRSLVAAAVILSLVVPSAATVRSHAAKAATSDVTLNMWTWKQIHIAGWQAVAAAFKAQTGITVNVQAFSPDATFRTKLIAAGQAKQLPDIVSYWSNDFTLQSDGYLVDLTGKIDCSAYIPGTCDTTSVVSKAQVAQWRADPKDYKQYFGLQQGHLWTVPALAGSPNFMFFNKAMMKKAGLNPNVAPATFEDLISDLKKVTAAGQPGFAAGIKNPDVPFYWIVQPAYAQMVGQQAYEDQMTGYAPIDNPQFVKMLTLFKSLGDNHQWIPGVSNVDIDPADAAFAAGRSSLDVGGTYTYAALLQLGVPAGNILTFNVPAPKGSVIKKFDNAAFSLIDEGITKTSQHQDEALQWLKFSTGPEGMAIFAKIAKDLPAAKEPADASVVGPAVASLESFFQNSHGGTVNAIQDKTPNGKNASPGSATQLFETNVQLMVLGQGDPSSIATSVQAAIKASNDLNFGKGKLPPHFVVPKQ